MPKEKILIFLSFLTTFIFLFSFIAYAWQEPTSNPPGGNVYAPVNTGPSDQFKSGRFGAYTSGIDPNYGFTVGSKGIKATGNSYFEGDITATGQICDKNGCIGDITTYWTLSTDNTKLYPNDTGWNIGVGTTNPDQRLEISGGGIQLNAEYGIGFTGDIPYDGNVSGDRAKIYYDNDFIGTYGDFLVIEKTDGNSADPDGGIVFTNKGNDNVRETAMIIRGNGNVGIGVTDPGSYKLYVDGNIAVSTGHGYFYTSDRSFKTNIQPLENSLNKILKLQGVSFNWKNTGEPSIGLIAQDVEKVFPEVVSGKEGEKTIDYAVLVAPLIEATKEQQKEIEELKAEIKELKSKIK